MKNGIIISTVLLSIFMLTCCSSDNSTLPSCSFRYAGTLSDGGTVKMKVDIECSEENDVAKIEKKVGTIKRVLTMAFLQQKTGDLKESGQHKVRNSLYKIIKKFANTKVVKITVSEFEIAGKS